MKRPLIRTDCGWRWFGRPSIWLQEVWIESWYHAQWRIFGAIEKAVGYLEGQRPTSVLTVKGITVSMHVPVRSRRVWWLSPANTLFMDHNF